MDFVQDPCMEMDHQEGGRSIMQLSSKERRGDGGRTKVELIKDVPWVIRGGHD